MEKISVLGCGSWGTALAKVLAENGHQVTMWARKPAQLEEMSLTHENKKYLPGVELPANLLYESDIKKAVSSADTVLFSIPAQQFSSVFEGVKDLIGDKIVINVAKGIEQKSLKRLSEIAREIKPDVNYVVLSGPSHAEEVGRRLPTTVTVASKSEASALKVQDLFMNKYMRVYTNSDVTGLELGGALKNIIALGAGISDGLGNGDNAKAAMMTRGITEITRLGVKLGANPDTFAGLSGVGDLIVTCCSMHSRNRRCGILMGQGMSPEEAVKQVGMVVEGFYTTEAAYKLACKNDIEMPITEAIYRLINGQVKVEEAVMGLMTRSRKSE